jgi:hypothetical protein
MSSDPLSHFPLLVSFGTIGSRVSMMIDLGIQDAIILYQILYHWQVSGKCRLVQWSLTVMVGSIHGNSALSQ